MKNNLRYLVSFIIFINSFPLFAQNIFIKAYGTSEAEGIISLKAQGNNIFLLGSHLDHSYITKVNVLGEIVWNKSLTTVVPYRGTSMEVTKDKGVAILGILAGYEDPSLIKLDSLGNVKWAKKIGGGSTDNGNSFQQTDDKGYIITGETWRFTSGGADAYLIKYDSIGNLQWTKVYGGSADERTYSVKQTAEGGYFVVGKSGKNLLLIKTNLSGDSLWTKLYQTNSPDEDFDFQQTNDKGYIIAGRTDNYGVLGDVFLLKTDSIGNVE